MTRVCRCETERYCKGVCKPCYDRLSHARRTADKPRIRQAPPLDGKALCHSERPFYAKGQCQACYERDGYARRTKFKPRVRRRPGPPECHPDRKHEARGLCEACYKAHQVRQNPERYKEYARVERAKRRPKSRAAIRKWSLWQKFKITPEQYDEMLAAQDSLCALCLRHERTKSKRLAVDHCHATGLVRGLLCGPCNVVLGYIENPEWFGRAQAYLEKHKARGAA